MGAAQPRAAPAPTRPGPAATRRRPPQRRSPADADDDAHGAAGSRPSRLPKPEGVGAGEAGAAGSGHLGARAGARGRRRRRREESAGRPPSAAGPRHGGSGEQQGRCAPRRSAPQRAASPRCTRLPSSARAPIGRPPPRRGQWGAARRGEARAHWARSARLAPDRAAARPLGGVHWRGGGRAWGCTNAP